ncbi:MAG: ornithine carbamoyltransferase [Bdellovibrionaceae bacterium]|nr:ornithine carbamoyltransferase [Pseudobdellovibrionaceae bacterium]
MFKIKSPFFLTGEELSHQELTDLIENSLELKKNRFQHQSIKPLSEQTVALVFDKPSLRTRLSFTVGVQELGGHIIELTSSAKKNEDPEDTIRVMQGMVCGLMWRTFAHSNLERMLPYAKIPIINGLSDLHHPCQALADLMTLKEKFGQLKGLKLCYLGDGNNVLHSLLLLLPFMGVDVHYCCPDGYLPHPEILQRAHLRASKVGAKINFFTSAKEAVKNTDAIYTDVWTSMGNEANARQRSHHFIDLQLNAELYQLAKSCTLIMHCLPMNKGQEITEEMANHRNSALFIQAENRLHAQKALMLGIWNGLSQIQAQDIIKHDKSTSGAFNNHTWQSRKLDID